MISYQVNQVGHEWFVILYHGNDEVDEALLAECNDVRNGEIAQLAKVFEGFTGSYDDAWGIFNAWVEKL